MDFDFTPVDSIDKVPEQFRPLYAPQPAADGKYTVDPNFGKVAEALNGFNRTTKQLRADLKKAAPTDLSPLAEYGDTIEAITEGIKTKITEVAGAKGADLQKQIDKVKESMAQANVKEIEKRDARVNALQAQLHTLLVDNAATSAVVELKGVPDLLLPFIRQQVKVAEQDGRFIVNVVDGQGEVRYGATGQPMSIKELVSEMKANEKFGRLFESETPPGGGFRPGAGQQAPRQANNGAERTSVDKIGAGLAARQRGGIARR